MSNRTEGDEILLDGKCTVLDRNLYLLCSHVEKGRRKFAPEVQPVRPPPINILAHSGKGNPLIEKLRKLRMSAQLERLKELRQLMVSQTPDT